MTVSAFYIGRMTMKIHTIKCPSCDASVYFKEGDTVAKCEYCGNVLVTDDHFDRKATARRVGSRIAALAEATQEIDRCKALRIRDEALINKLKGKLKKYVPPLGNIIRLIVPVIIALCLVAYIADGYPNILACIVLTGMTYLSYRLSTIICRKRAGKISEELDRYKKEYSELANKITKLRAENDFTIVPQQYRDSDSLEYLSSALLKNEAYDLDQAIALYKAEQQRIKEKEFLKTRLEEQQRQIDALKNQNNNSSGKKNKKSMDSSIGIGDGIAAVGTTVFLGAKLYKKLKDFSDD